MLQDELGSIMKYFYNINPVTIYTDTMPQGFKLPSMYFPVPIVLSSGDSLSTYKNSYQMFIKFFGKTTREAFQEAQKAAESLKKARMIIPYLNPDGSFSGGYLRLNKGQVKELEEKVVQLTLDWDSRYPYDREVYEKMGQFFLDTIVK